MWYIVGSHVVLCYVLCIVVLCCSVCSGVINRKSSRRLSSCYNIHRPNGSTFIAPAGTSEFAKRWHPIGGDIVSFKHRGLLSASGRPKHPVLHRLRTDIAWEDVVSNWKEQKPISSGKPFCLLLLFG